MITVSSCGVKLQEVLSGLEKERLKHWRYTCTFVAFLNITILFFFSFTWSVIFTKKKKTLGQRSLRAWLVLFLENMLRLQRYSSSASGRIYVHFIYTGNKYKGHILSARIKRPKSALFSTRYFLRTMWPTEKRFVLGGS